MSWLWKSDASSPASYEKALSKLSGQIATASLALDTTRSRGRRIKALWTLYTTLTYVLSLLILVLVIGPSNWTIPHYGGVLGGPAAIYLVRFLLTTVFDWSASRKTVHLNHLQKQRDTKITELKKATKYDSTQELLQKYGGVAPKEQNLPQSLTTPVRKPVDGERRTGLPPPPTANIQQRPPGRTPDLQRGAHHAPPALQGPPSSPFQPDEPGFGPNAFSAPPSRTTYEQTPHWYDRILDVMLGEDETLAKNRLVLLCQNCRLVNGQAPPGVKSLEELGKWRCANCKAWNGLENEASKIVKEITAGAGPVDDGLVDDKHVQETIETVLQEDSGVGTAVEAEAGPTKRATRSTGEKLVDGL